MTVSDAVVRTGRIGRTEVAAPAGRMTHLALPRISDSAVRRTAAISRAGKQAKSGPLTFATVRHVSGPVAAARVRKP